MFSYSEDDVIKILDQVNKIVINHPQISGTDYGIDEASKQFVIRVYTESQISYKELGITPVINNVPIKMMKDGPFIPQ